MKEPDIAYAIEIHKKTLKLQENEPPLTRGIEGLNLLESALNAAFSPYISDIRRRACRLLVGVIKNHPFVDGNKRTAWVLFRDFCKQNNLNLKIPNTLEVVNFLECLAASQENIKTLVGRCIEFFKLC